VSDRPTIAVLGTGIMGSPIASQLIDHGFDVRVWNRTADKTRPLADRGATVAATPADAADSADVVLTMLANGQIVQEVMAGERGALAAMPPAAIWLQMSTVGVAASADLAALAEQAGVGYVDCPVLGTRQPAEQGTLVVLESGPAELSDRCRPVFEAIGSRVIRVGSAGAASRLKMVCNNWVLAITNATAESVALAGALDVDPNLLLDAMRGGNLDCQYLHIKARDMIDEDYRLSFAANLAAKDARLILDACGDRADLAGTRAALNHLDRTRELGHGEQDMGALYEAVREQRP
jgi:3-hydroxyisobutyrate dehydrogenase